MRCDAFVIEFFKVNFDVDKVAFVCLAVSNVEPNFRLEILQNSTLQQKSIFALLDLISMAMLSKR